MNKLFGSAIAFVLSLCLVAGCSTIENNPNTARLAVGYATLKLLENSAPTVREARRVKINQIATEAKALVTGESVPLSLLESVVRSKIDFTKLSPADAYLADALIAAVMQELQNRVGEGLLDPKQSLVVASVLDWVIEATTVATQL